MSFNDVCQIDSFEQVLQIFYFLFLSIERLDERQSSISVVLTPCVQFVPTFGRIEFSKRKRVYMNCLAPSTKLRREWKGWIRSPHRHQAADDHHHFFRLIHIAIPNVRPKIKVTIEPSNPFSPPVRR